MKGRGILLLLAAAVLASAGWLMFRQDRTQNPVVRITRDGVLLEEIRLDRLDQPVTRTFEDEHGRNTLLLEPGCVRMAEADCPDQICVKQGAISDGTVPIVCLPHRFMVEIADGGGGLDGGAG